MYFFVYVYTQMSLWNLLFLCQRKRIYMRTLNWGAALQLCILNAAAATWGKFLVVLLLLGIDQTKM